MGPRLAPHPPPFPEPVFRMFSDGSLWRGLDRAEIASDTHNPPSETFIVYLRLIFLDMYHGTFILYGSLDHVAHKKDMSYCTRA